MGSTCGFGNNRGV
uniref:Uncharacterized protein n=1 Tax=Anguilla anguilla TaxID=7936 RepID=A0A0E9XJS6_ANGAN